MAQQCSVEEIKDSYNWQQAFEVSRSMPCANYNGNSTGISVNDIVQVIASDEGAHDVENWLGVFRLLDGRCIFVTAWCDYTGWDCQSGGQIWVAEDLESLVQYAINTPDRTRLGLP